MQLTLRMRDRILSRAPPTNESAYEVMSSSPLLHAKPMASPSVHKRYSQFTEASPRTVVGLQKANVQLQREIEKIERQSQTAVNNIANHQQAMKMSWRRLEEKRMAESPLLSRDSHKASKVTPTRKILLSSNTTRLYVPATPDVYGTEADSSSKEDLPTSHSATHLQPVEWTQTKMSAHVKSSPYLSPFAVRRTAFSPHPRPVTSHQTVLPPKLAPPRAQTAMDFKLAPPMDGHHRRHSLEDIKLPPISPTSSQTALVASPNTVDKDTLLQASAMMGLGPHSHTPDDFRSFYALSGGDRPRSQMVILSPPPTVGGDGAEASATGQEEIAGDGELTLSEMFEQIKHCRYIRHYYPDGTPRDDI